MRATLLLMLMLCGSDAAQEFAAIRKELDEIREELKSRGSCNDQHNSHLTLEWAMEAVAELRREMKEIEAANNASEWQQELRNKVALILVEAEGVSKIAAADEARLAAHDGSLKELMMDVEQAKDMAAAAKQTCDAVKQEVEMAQSNWRKSLKRLHKQMYYAKSENSVINQDHHEHHDDAAFTHIRLRHLHSMHKQIHELKHSHQKFYEIQKSLKYDMISMQKRLDHILEKSNAVDDMKLEAVAETQKKHTKIIQNMTSEMENFNKMHVSMLELLENMENLENKVDKTIPDFQREISKIAVDMVQLHSQNEYLKEDHGNVHQSIKAIAVSVSNLMDKVDEHRMILKTINKTVDKMNEDHKNQPTMEIKNTHEKNRASIYNEFQDYKNTEMELEKIGEHLSTSCDEVDGIINNHLISPGHGMPTPTMCENGWTLIQRRINGSVDFNRKYQEYKSSFGEPDGEFWIGNEALHKLTQSNCSSLRIELVDLDDVNWYAEYSYFKVDPADFGYQLHVNGHSGNVSDALSYQDGMEFSTVDRDRDGSRGNCAASYEGGWWFSHCQHVNLNGRYSLGLKWFDSAQNRWVEVKASKMMLRENKKCHL